MSLNILDKSKIQSCFIVIDPIRAKDSTAFKTSIDSLTTSLNQLNLLILIYRKTEFN